MVFLFLLLGQLEFKTVSQWDLGEFDIYSSFSMVQGHEGRIFLLNRHANEVVIIDAEGKLIKRVGREGEGPGEFQMATDICWQADDKTFMVSDQLNKRVSKWSVDGELIKEFPLKVFGQFMASPAPEYVLMARHSGGQRGNNPKLLKYDLGSDEQKIIWTHVLPKPAEVTGNDPKKGPRISILFSWDPGMLFDTGADFAAVTWTGSRVVEVIDFKGERLAKITHKMPVYPVKASLIDEEINSLPLKYRQIARDNLIKREYMPMLLDIRVDSVNRIWVFGAREKENDPVAFQVFAKSGKLLGEGHLNRLPYLIQEKTMFIVDEVETEGEEKNYLNKLSFSL